MITIEENISLRHLNTFGIAVKARYYVDVSSEGQLQEVIRHPVYLAQARLILGGGSNILFTKDFEGLVIKSSLVGRAIKKETTDTVLLEVGAGENWHELVMYCIQHDWGGVENLSLIPGTVGAAPMQNIGAYGMEIKDVIENVTGFNLQSGVRRTFTNSDCRFNYRESIFKQEAKGKYFISSITLRLTKKMHHLRMQYGAIQEVLKRRAVEHPTIKDVSDAIISIRRSKLPDPKVIGNAGSFFKNPTVREEVFAEIKNTHPLIPSYPADSQNVKIPAAWLIEQCGWKGKRNGNVGVHPQQALVLVNYGIGKGEEIVQLAIEIQASVKEKFGLTLATEVNII